MTAVPPLAVLGCAASAIVASPILRLVVARLRAQPGPSTPIDRGRFAGQWTSGLVIAAATLIAGVVAPGVTTFALLVVGSVLLVVVSMVDLAERRIPNLVTYPMIATCLGSAVAAASTGHGDAAASALVGGATFASVLFGLHWFRPEAMGLGDVKLVFPLGFAIGWILRDAAIAPAAVGFTLAAASLIGLAPALGAHRGSAGMPFRGQPIPFGPPLSIAAAVTIVVSLSVS